MGGFTDYLDHGSTIKESIHDKNLFKAVFMAGGTGAGKSFISNTMFKGLPINFVNSDSGFEYLLKRNDLPFTIDTKNKEVYEKQMSKMNAAKALTKERTLHWIDGMLPLVIDGTGREYDRTSAQKELLEYVGYDTAMIFVNTSLEVAMQRNQERERKVDAGISKQIWEHTQQNIGKYQNLFGDGNFTVIDNSKKLSPEEIEKLKVDLTRKAIKFLNVPLKNKIGKAILRKLEEKGGSYLHDLAGSVDTEKLKELKV